jgi:hypothetical protein
MRELRHPWLLLHNRDRESRQRRTKPRRQCGLSGATSPLSLRYLFCRFQAPLKSYGSSLSPAFTPAFFAVQKTVRQAFALTLYSRFPTWMSLSLGPIDTFSTGRRPSQTARQLLSLKSERFYQKWVVLHFCSINPKRLTSTLLPTLSTFNKITTTGCSKGLQGLRFPLGDTGLYTGEWFRKTLVRDSDNLVKPFMHVSIQKTRHYATLRAS